MALALFLSAALSQAVELGVPTAVVDAATDLGVTKIHEVNEIGDTDGPPYYIVRGTNADGATVELSIDANGKALPVIEDPDHGGNGQGGEESRDPVIDTDGDGLSDKEEVEVGTDPNFSDTDGDGFTDGVEDSLESDPLSPENVPDVLSISANGRDRDRVVVVSVATAPGVTFQLEQSDGRGTWVPFGAKIEGDGTKSSIQVPASIGRAGMMFRLAIAN